MTQEIEIKIHDGVQVIRFTRADKKNAFTGPMYNAMSEALDAADRNDAIAVTVFIGSGGVFSAGTTSTISCAALPPSPQATARASRHPRSISFAACPR